MRHGDDLASGLPNMLAAALWYVGRGYRVFPCHSMVAGACSCGAAGCSKGKHPRIAGGFLNASADREIVTAWWTRWPSANIAIATGDVVVVDIDPRHGGDEALAALRSDLGSDTFDTVTALTGGGGSHLWYAAPQFGSPIRNSAQVLGPGLDVRGAGGYVIVPPSNHESGTPYRWEVDYAPHERELLPFPDALRERLVEAEHQAAKTIATDADRWTEGNRHGRMVSLAGTLRRKALGEAVIFAALQAANIERCDPQCSEKSLRDIARDYAKRPVDGTRKADPPPFGASEQPDDDPRKSVSDALASIDYNTEQRVSEQFIADYGDDIRCVHEQASKSKTYYIWNGKRWGNESSALLGERMQQLARKLTFEAVNSESATRLQDIKFAHSCENRIRQLSIVALACEVLPIRSSQDAFDGRPMLLNVQNGTIDLKTGILQPHNPADMLTVIAPVSYEPSAKCPRWDRFLSEIFVRCEDGKMVPDFELIAFIQRAIGYSLTGDPREDAILLLHGRGSNGKSTFLEVVTDLLGEYACATSPDTFLNRKDDAATNDIAKLHKKRLVTAQEVGNGRRLSEAFVKSVTGGDKIPARFLYKEYFDFLPEFTLWFACNHVPNVKDTDDGIWSRLKLVPFLAQFPRGTDLCEQGLKETLAAEAAGIFAWAVAGCIDYFATGLGEPTAVKDATAAYRKDQDKLRPFFDDRCELGPKHRASTPELLAAYTAWAGENGEPGMTSNALTRLLKERGFLWWPDKKPHGFLGIGLSTTKPDLPTNMPSQAEQETEDELLDYARGLG